MITMLFPGLVDADIAVLAAHLKQHTNTVEQVRLVKNRITDQGFLSLVRVLAHNEHVHTLNLTDNYLTTKSL